MTPDHGPNGDAHWTRGVLSGAILGGIGWGVFAAGTAGSAGDQAHLESILRPHLLVAVAISAIFLITAAVLARFQAGSRTLLVRAAAITLVVAPLSGWFFLGLQFLQALVTRM